MKPTAAKEYWEKNIEGFAGFYDVGSEENILGPVPLIFLYRKLIFPIEKIFMVHRHQMVCEFIGSRVKKGMRVADIGCGSGIYTKAMVEKGAYVFAIDYSESAILLTGKNLTEEEKKSVEIIHSDITKQCIPEVDLAVSIGVLPYIGDAERFFGNILPFTQLFLFNYLDKNNPLNLIRQVLKTLDVRKYSYHGSGEVNEKLTACGFRIISRKRLATGFIIETKNTA